MPSTPSLPEGPAQALDAARRADAAAAAAQIRIELAESAGHMRAVAQLLVEVWASAPGHDPLAPDVLRSVAHAGGAVHAAYHESILVGACAAVFGPPESRSVYSLIAATRSSDRGVGFALKQAQRAWALACGATQMRWTFDPLVSRNARFNLGKLGAIADTYAVDFYGPLEDELNAGDESDRLSAVWTLTASGTTTAAKTALTGPDLSIAEPDCGVAPDGGPIVVRDASGLWCRVPTDIVAVRRADPALAARWRAAVRDIFVPAFADGLVATAMTRDGWYRLEEQLTEERA